MHDVHYVLVSLCCAGLICIRDLDIHDLLSEEQITSACEGLAFVIKSFHVDAVSFGTPDLLRWSFDVKCHGCSLELRQKAMPEV